MNMMFRGVKLTGVKVVDQLTSAFKTVYFDGLPDYATRVRFEDAGYPVWFSADHKKFYFVIDSALLPEFNTYKVIDDNKSCECGASAVKASRHSQWCPCN